MADRTLVVKLVGDEADLLRSYTRAGRATKEFGNTAETSLGKADKRLRSFKAAGAGFAGGFIASEVFANLTTFIDKASESEAVLTQVRQGLRNTGQSWEQYGDVIDQTVRAQSRLGFDDEDLLQSFDKFNRQVGDVNRALKLNNIAMDVARGRSISLEAATTLVTKAQAGQRGALTRLGIEVDKTATKTDLLRALTEKYGGSAEAAAGDAATAQARLAVAIENVQESIGTLLLPAVSELANQLARASDNLQKVIGGLSDLGKAKIPVLDIPVNFKLPGGPDKLFQGVGKRFLKQLAGPAQIFTVDFPGLINGNDRSRTADAIRSRRGPGGGPIVVESNTTVEIDGEAVGRSQKKVTEKDRRRNPRQKRGPNSAFR